MKPKRRLRANQRKAAYLLATGRPGHEVARELGIKYDTLSRWLRKMEFLAEYERWMEDTYFAMDRGLIGLLQEAIGTTQQVMTSQDDPKRLQSLLNVLRTFPNMFELSYNLPKIARNMSQNVLGLSDYRRNLPLFANNSPQNDTSYTSAPKIEYYREDD